MGQRQRDEWKEGTGHEEEVGKVQILKCRVGFKMHSKGLRFSLRCPRGLRQGAGRARATPLPLNL